MSSNPSNLLPDGTPTRPISVLRAERAQDILLYTAFLATGLALVLPGTLLPVLLARWTQVEQHAIADSHAGALLFVFSVGTMLGALLARGSLGRSVARGCALAGCGLLGLAGTTVLGHGDALIFLTIATFGCGLGILMTSISVLESRRHPEERVARMARLNLVWASGACVGPWIELNSSSRFGLPTTLGVASACLLVFAVMSLMTLSGTDHQPSPRPVAARPHRLPLGFPMLALWLMVPLTTGVESAVGGWLSTYTKRSGQTLNGIVAETTCFWAGILLSRVLLSDLRVAARLSRMLLWLSPCVVVVSLGLLLTANPGAMLSAAVLLGLGCGPLYPLLIARVLAHGERGNMIFVIAGIGSSTLPLLTGVISGREHSLRLGLGVPLGAALLLLMCGVLVFMHAGQQEAETA